MLVGSFSVAEYAIEPKKPSRVWAPAGEGFACGVAKKMKMKRADKKLEMKGGYRRRRCRRRDSETHF